MVKINKLRNIIPLFSILLVLVFSGYANNYFRSEYATLHLFFMLLFLILLLRKKIVVNKALLVMSYIWILYNVIFSLVYSVFSINALFYFIVIICIVYITMIINGSNLISNISKVIYYLALISLFFYVIQTISFSLAYSIVRPIQDSLGVDTSGWGRHGLVFSNIIVYTLYDFPSGIPGFNRNYGFMWEPGGFASILLIGFFSHLYSNGFNIKDRVSLVYIVTILTTFSTTGFVGIIVIFIYVSYSRFRLSLISIFGVVIAIGFSIFIINTHFVSGKIEESYSQGIKYSDVGRHSTVGSLGRFGGLFINLKEFNERPILGYNYDKSKRIANEYAGSVNGLGNTLARYGLILFFFYIIGYMKSSKALFYKFSNANYVFFMLLLICAFAFNLNRSPFFMIFFAYGFLISNKTNNSNFTKSYKGLNEKMCNY